MFPANKVIGTELKRDEANKIGRDIIIFET
jgi:hypothetical protein